MGKGLANSDSIGRLRNSPTGEESDSGWRVSGVFLMEEGRMGSGRTLASQPVRGVQSSVVRLGEEQ